MREAEIAFVRVDQALLLTVLLQTGIPEFISFPDDGVRAANAGLGSRSPFSVIAITEQLCSVGNQYMKRFALISHFRCRPGASLHAPLKE